MNFSAGPESCEAEGVLARTTNTSEPESTVSQRTKRNWRYRYWPNICDLESATKAAKTAANMAFLFSGTAAFLWILSIVFVFKMSVAVLIDAILFTAVGLGIRSMWRSASVIGLLLHLVKVGNGVAHTPVLIVVYTLTTLVFANGIRGTVAYRKFTG